MTSRSLKLLWSKIGKGDGVGNGKERHKMITREKFLEPEIRDGVEVSAEMKAAWKVLLDMLEEFIRICEKYDLKYCLDGGTMLGAIRHKGFVPWDDDVDVSLPRADFQRFLEIAKNELKPPHFLQYGTTDPEHFKAFACIRNNQTSGIDMLWVCEGRRYNMGIGMDIFPFDDVPEKAADLKGLLWRNKQFIRVFRHALSHNLKGWRKWITHPCFLLLYKLIGNDRLVKWRDRNFAAYTDTNATRYGNIAYQLGNERGIFRKEVFKDRIKVPFEYIEAYVPGGYEEYLSHLYGVNWRTPIRDAGDHGALIMDAKQPYKKLLVERFGYKKEWVENLP